MTEIVRCSVQNCEKPAASPESRCLCRRHLILTCYEQLDEYRRWQEERLSPDGAAEPLRQFLLECSLRVAKLALDLKEFTNLERAQLLDILLQVTDLSRHLRQSPRIAVSIPVQLRGQESCGTWEEQTRTRVISRHGAMLECEHPVKMEETLLVVRMDTGRQAHAQVVWRWRRVGGTQEIGIEFLDSENFWDLDSGSPEIVGMHGLTT